MAEANQPDPKTERAWQALESPDNPGSPNMPYWVGHYDPVGFWHPDTEQSTLAAAMLRVSLLNGRLSKYVYIRVGPVWHVGYYDQQDAWHHANSQPSQEAAAQTVIRLNNSHESSQICVYRLLVESFVTLGDLQDQLPWLAEIVQASSPGDPLEVNVQLGLIRYKLTTE